jgi:hypothetical protein
MISEGSDLRAKLSRGLLRLTEEGRLSELKLKWWPTQHCDDMDSGHIAHRQGHLSQLGSTPAELTALVEP